MGRRLPAGSEERVALFAGCGCGCGGERELWGTGGLGKEKQIIQWKG